MMSPSAVRRGLFRWRVLLVMTAVLAPWVAPGSPLPAGVASDRSDRRDHRAQAGGCGTNWGTVEQLGDLPGNLLEISGFVSSAKYPGVAWMIQDSDNDESLFAFELDGGTPRWREFDVDGADNYDWEDIAYSVGPDGRGRIWILENGVETGPKKIYEIEEPDPRRGDDDVRVENTYRFEYPGQNYNTEALFTLGGRLAVVTKTHPNRLYTLPADLSRHETNYASDAGRLDVSSWVTMAAISPDERHLAIVTTADELSIIEPRGHDRKISSFAGPEPAVERSLPDIQLEAGDFFPYGSCDVVIVSEDSSVWRIPNRASIAPRGSPGAPSGVRAVPGDGAATVTWAPADGGGPEPITGYRVAAHHDGAEVASVTAPEGSTSAVVAGLANGTAYTFTVAALSPSGPGPASAPSAPVTPGAPSTDGPPPATDADPPGARAPHAQAPHAPAPAAGSGYWMVDAGGAVYAFGPAPHRGDATDLRSGAADLEATPTGEGYWVVEATGQVHAFGDARHLGDVDPATLAAGETVTSLSATPDGAGYWIFTDRGRVLAFGGAVSHGDLTDLSLNAAVLDSVATPSGAGYYMVAADGGVFAFGDAGFLGSMGGTPLNAPVQSLVPDPDGTGYWLVASDGGVFSFAAPFRGSIGSLALNREVVGMVAYGDGYLMVAADGGVFNFSDRDFHGSLGDRPPAEPIVAVAAG